MIFRDSIEECRGASAILDLAAVRPILSLRPTLLELIKEEPSRDSNSSSSAQWPACCHVRPGGGDARSAHRAAPKRRRLLGAQPRASCAQRNQRENQERTDTLHHGRLLQMGL